MGQHSSRVATQDPVGEKRRIHLQKHRPPPLDLRGQGLPLGYLNSVPPPRSSRPASIRSTRSIKKISHLLRRCRSSADVSSSYIPPASHHTIPVPSLPTHPLPTEFQHHGPLQQSHDGHCPLTYAQRVPKVSVVAAAPTLRWNPLTIANANSVSYEPRALAIDAAPTATDADTAFRIAYPEYASTLPLDLLRKTEYSRLRPEEVYVDSMGGALYPEFLVRAHAAFLESAVLGNTHSQSASSQLSTSHAAAARDAVLSYFNAPAGSKVIFTANASQALKLVGESFPFGPGSVYLLPEDAHNSVHGIREFATRAGADVVYMPGRTGRGGVDIAKARRLLEVNKPLPGDSGLAAFTGLSNLTNTKISLQPIASTSLPTLKHRKSTSVVSLPTPPPSAKAASFSSSQTSQISPPASTSSSPPPDTGPDATTFLQPSILAHARSLGYITLLDAAALAPGSTLDLSATPVDAVAISFYKMFGYPTGIGALILAPGAGEFLLYPRQSGAGGRPWFAGGTVDVVQVPGYVMTRSHVIEEAFEDGTLNYLQLPSIPLGLSLLQSYLPFLPTRLAALTHFLASGLSSLSHVNGSPATRVLSRVPGWISNVGNAERRRRLPQVRYTGGMTKPHVPDPAWESDEDRDGEGTGGTVSFVILEPDGELVPLSIIAASAAANGIMLRTGCMCNPGGAAALLGLSPFMADLRAGATLDMLEEAAGYELGVIRVSFGLVSNWEDAWAVACWARKGIAEDWATFRKASASTHAAMWQPAIAV